MVAGPDDEGVGVDVMRDPCQDPGGRTRAGNLQERGVDAALLCQFVDLSAQSAGEFPIRFQRQDARSSAEGPWLPDMSGCQPRRLSGCRCRMRRRAPVDSGGNRPRRGGRASVGRVLPGSARGPDQGHWPCLVPSAHLAVVVPRVVMDRLGGEDRFFFDSGHLEHRLLRVAPLDRRARMRLLGVCSRQCVVAT